MAKAIMLYYCFHEHVKKLERESRRGRAEDRGIRRREVACLNFYLLRSDGSQLQARSERPIRASTTSPSTTQSSWAPARHLAECCPKVQASSTKLTTTGQREPSMAT